jgi:hypothetical protein
VARLLGINDEDQLPSRAAMAMVDMLLDAGRQEGHSFLPWDQLETKSLAHLNAAGPYFPQSVEKFSILDVWLYC